MKPNSRAKLQRVLHICMSSWPSISESYQAKERGLIYILEMTLWDSVRNKFAEAFGGQRTEAGKLEM